MNKVNMNIPEYYQCEAERVDNSETVRGYYVYCRARHYILPHDINGFDERYYDWIEVKPETVRRVAVEPIFNGDAFHFCPNCVEINGTVSYDFLVDPVNAYCRRCGLRLKWGNEGEKTNE